MWTQILRTTGNFPLEDVVPPAGTVFGALASGGVGSTITFALCNGNAYGINGSTLGAGGLGLCGPPGAFVSGAGSTNVAVTTSAVWNALRTTTPGGTAGAACLPAPTLATGFGCPSIYTQVFGFEDRSLTGAGGPIADADFSDLVFSTNLSTTIPEPSTVLLMSAGLLGLVGAARRRNNKA